MYRITLTVICLATMIGGSLLGTLARADGPESPRAPRTDRSTFANGTAPYAIYCGFGCSRSFRKVGDFPCLKSAHKTLASPDVYFTRAWIVVPGRTHKAPGIHKPETFVERCSVYVAEGSKLRLHKEVATVAEADAIVQQLKQEGGAGAFKVCYLK